MNSKIRSALIQGWIDCNTDDMPTQYDNVPFTPDPQTPWASVHLLPNQPIGYTHGQQGLDKHDGIMQIDLNYPLTEGESAVQAMSDTIQEYFIAGRRLSYSGQDVIIWASGCSQGRQVAGWYRVSITIPWEARVVRPALA